MSKGKKFDWVSVCTPTAFNGQYAQIVGENNVREQFDEKWLDTVLANQREAKRNGQLNPGLLILDDCVGHIAFNSNLFTRLATAGRHYNLTVWISFKIYTKCPPVLRSNADYVFILASMPEKTARAIIDEFTPEGFDTYRELQVFAKQALVNFGCLLIDRADESKIKCIRAPSSIVKFRLS